MIPPTVIPEQLNPVQCESVDSSCDPAQEAVDISGPTTSASQGLLDIILPPFSCN
jgi:hypothetical protein